MKHECELCKLPIRKCGHLRRILLNGILFYACEGCRNSLAGFKLMNPEILMSKLSRKDILEKISGVKA
jgi:hypothetical protein